MSAPLAVDAQGNALLRFETGTEDDLQDGDPSIPLPLALVVATGASGTLLVLNRWREEWELPGGMIEAAESPREAACREFVEETDQDEPDLEYVGRATFRLTPGGRLEHAAVYRTTIDELQPFTANDEVERLCWWDGGPIPALAELDAEIVRLAVATDAAR